MASGRWLGRWLAFSPGWARRRLLRRSAVLPQGATGAEQPAARPETGRPPPATHWTPIPRLVPPGPGPLGEPLRPNPCGAVPSGGSLSPCRGSYRHRRAFPEFSCVAAANAGPTGAWRISVGHGEAASRAGRQAPHPTTGVVAVHGPASRLPAGRSGTAAAPLPRTARRTHDPCVVWRPPHGAARQGSGPSTASLAPLELVAAGPRSKKEEP
jgi:hypothetical protein